MKLLFIENEKSELRYERSSLFIYENGVRIASIPVHSLERIIVAPHVVLAAGVLGFIASHRIELLIFNSRYPDRTATLSSYLKTDVNRRVKQIQLLDNDKFRLQWSIRIVLTKILRQYTLLLKMKKLRLDMSWKLSEAICRLNNLITQLEDKGVSSLATLRGIEGAASACYFNVYTKLFAGQLNFTERNRRPPKDPVNACLSLTYTLLHHEAVAALRCGGLDPAVGCYHELNYNRESFACDLIEPLRPVIDLWLWQLFRERSLRVEHFTYDDGACFMSKAGKQHFYAAYYQKIISLRKCLRRYVQIAVKALNDVH
jgi:CRISPR-associated protein Cas1